MIAFRKDIINNGICNYDHGMTNVKNMYGLTTQSCNHMWHKQNIYSY